MAFPRSIPAETRVSVSEVPDTGYTHEEMAAERRLDRLWNMGFTFVGTIIGVIGCLAMLGKTEAASIAHSAIQDTTVSEVQVLQARDEQEYRAGIATAVAKADLAYQAAADAKVEGVKANAKLDILLRKLGGQ